MKVLVLIDKHLKIQLQSIKISSWQKFEYESKAAFILNQ